MRITVWFTRSNTLKGRLVRLLAASPWEYCALQINKEVYELDQYLGPIVRNERFFKDEWGHYTRVTLDVENTDKLKFFLSHEKDIKRSWLGYLPGLFLRRWRISDKWTPAEYVCEALAYGGMQLNPPQNRVTPVRLWSMLPVLQTLSKSYHDSTSSA